MVIYMDEYKIVSKLDIPFLEEDKKHCNITRFSFYLLIQHSPLSIFSLGLFDSSSESKTITSSAILNPQEIMFYQNLLLFLSLQIPNKNRSRYVKILKCDEYYVCMIRYVVTAIERRLSLPRFQLNLK